MSSNNADLKLNQLFAVKGKVALVTGGGSGIGLMAAQALAVNGAKVYIVGRTERKLKTVADVHGTDIDGKIIPLVGDISDKQEIRRLVEEVESREDFLHILINNAGIWSVAHAPEGESAEEIKQRLFDPEDATFENWEKVYRTNTTSHYFMTTAFLPLLQKGSEEQAGYSSTVINISSTSGMIKISENHFPAGTCKAGTIQLTKVMAAELARAGLQIRVNSIAPGIFPSEMTAKTSDRNTQKSELPQDYVLTKDISARRPGNDQDMASAILFAATNQYLNGQIIVVDGGYLIQHGKV